MAMTVAKKKPATSADLHAKSVAMAAEVTVAEAEAASLETALGAALVAGDDAKAKDAQAALAEATAKAQRLAIGARAFGAATEAAAEAEKSARIAALEREYIEVRDRLHATSLAVADAILALRPMAAALSTDGRAAGELASKLGHADYNPQVVSYQLGRIAKAVVTGDRYAPRRAEERTTSEAMAMLSKPWRATTPHVPDDATAGDTEATEDD